MGDSHGVLTYNIIWTTLFLHIECSVAVIMGGVTAFEQYFPGKFMMKKTQVKSSSSSVLKRYIFRMFGNKGSTRGLSETSKRKDPSALLEGPKTTATLKRLRTFIRRNGHESNHTTLAGTMDSGDYDPLKSGGPADGTIIPERTLTDVS